MPTVIKQMEFYVPCEVIFEACSEESMAVFLDSSLHNELGRYSIIGLHPYLVMKEIDQVLYVNCERKEESFERYMETYMKEHMEVNKTELPLISGGIGYFTYDYGRKYVHRNKTTHQAYPPGFYYTWKLFFQKYLPNG